MNSPFIYSFFESIKTEVDLQSLIDEKREEDLHIEFKEKARRNTGELDESDKEAFSQCLSGFANADGGVLIFGIETKRSPDGVDQAYQLKPISDPDLFRARLMDSILSTTQPVVDRVCVDVIHRSAAEGYVKCYVPASDKPPHRAMRSGREYWTRASTGFRKMEHFELEDVFGRRQRPALRLRLELRQRPAGDPFEELHFFFLNEGRGVARHAGFLCNVGGDDCIVVAEGAALQLDKPRKTIAFYDAHSVVHPNGIFSALGHAIIRRSNKGDPLPLKITWYAENMAPRAKEFELTPNIEGTLL